MAGNAVYRRIMRVFLLLSWRKVEVRFYVLHQDDSVDDNFVQSLLNTSVTMEGMPVRDVEEDRQQE